MTIEEFLIKLGELWTAIVAWFTVGFETLIDGNWLQLTIGQGLFTGLVGLIIWLMVLDQWHEFRDSLHYRKQKSSDKKNS